MVRTPDDGGTWATAWLSDPEPSSSGYSGIAYSTLRADEGFFNIDTFAPASFELGTTIDIALSQSPSGLIGFVGNASHTRFLTRTDGGWLAAPGTAPFVGQGEPLHGSAAYGDRGVIFWRQAQVGRSGTVAGTSRSDMNPQFPGLGDGREVSAAGDVAAVRGVSTFVLWTDRDGAPPRSVTGFTPLGHPQVVKAGLNTFALLPSNAPGDEDQVFALTVGPTCFSDLDMPCGPIRPLEGPVPTTLFAAAANADHVFLADVQEVAGASRVLLYVYSMADILSPGIGPVAPRFEPRMLFTGPDTFDGDIGAIEMKLHESPVPDLVELTVMISARRTREATSSNDAYLHVLQFCF
jgi:hypothetical protein